MDATFLIWIVWGVGITTWPPPSKNLWVWGLFRVIYYFVGAVIGFAMVSMMVPLANHWLWFVAIKGGFVIIEVLATYFLLGENFSGSISKIVSCAYGIIGIGLLIGAGVTAGIYGYPADVNNAYYFNSVITTMPKGSIPFNETIPASMIRLTTSELAESIAKEKRGLFGSDIKIASSHVTMYEKRLVWISAIAPMNNTKIIGLVIVDANNPRSGVTVLNDVTFTLGENLNYDVWNSGGNNIAGRAWFSSDMAYSYGRAYITQDYIGKWYCVLTTYYIEPWSFVNKYRGVDVYDQDGKFFGHYESENTPLWVSQPYDEQTWLEGHINEWGRLRTATGFSKTAGESSLNRLEMNEDTRYIYDPEVKDVVAVVYVNSIGDKDSLAGMFKATRQGIFYYDLLDFHMISGTRAVESIDSVLQRHNSEVTATLQLGTFTNASLQYYYAQMPMLYYIDGEPVWHVPIYGEEVIKVDKEIETKKDTIDLIGLGLVDATDRHNLKIEYMEPGMTGEQLVRKTRLSFFNQIVEKDLPQRKQDVIGFFESNNVTIRESEAINPDVWFNEGTCNYTSSEQWETAQTVLSNFLARHADQKEILMLTDASVVTMRLGFWEYNADKNRSEFYYIVLNLQNIST